MTLPYLITNETITITYNHRPYYIYKSNEKFETVKDLIRKKDFESVIDLIIVKERLIRKTTEYFEITDNNEIYMKDALDEALPNSIAIRLLEFVENDLPLKPLVNFWKNLRENPIESAKSCLYRFLEYNNQSITDDGCFIAYKAVDFNTKDTLTQSLLKRYDNNISEMPESDRVNLKLLDKYTHTLDNSLGITVIMERDNVDSNPDITCSNGLHVAAYNYAKYSYNGDIVVEVLVNPKNVVAVPFDYNNQKIRVCEYTILNFVDDYKHDKIKNNDIPKLVNIDYLSIQKIDLNSKNKLLIDLTNKTAQEIIDLVYNLTNEKIEITIKSKKAIARKAKTILDRLDYDTLIDEEYL